MRSLRDSRRGDMKFIINFMAPRPMAPRPMSPRPKAPRPFIMAEHLAPYNSPVTWQKKDVPEFLLLNT